MCFFKNRRQKGEKLSTDITCPLCGSKNIRPTSRPGHIKVWRGQRSFVYRCNDCSRDFYLPEYKGLDIASMIEENQMIEDEEALHQAEEEIRQQTAAENDRTFN